MKQIRHLIYACLILVVSFAFIELYSIITSSESNNDDSSVVIETESSDDVSSQDVGKGKKIFQQNCQTCHSLDKALTGPALRDFTSRGPWAERENVYSWIHNPAGFAKKNLYAKDLVKQYNGVMMQAFPSLTKEDIDAVIEYVNTLRPRPTSLPAKNG